MNQLRTKFLLALLVVSAGLTGGTLLIVRHTIQNRIRESTRVDLRTSVNAFRTFELQRQEALEHSAQFIANLPTVRALMSTQDLATIQDGSGDLLKQSGAEALILTDRTGRVSAIQSRDSRLDLDNTQKLLDGTFSKGESHDWWFAGGRLYEVQLQPIEFGQFPAQTTIGILILGDEMDTQVAKSFREVAGNEAAFLWGQTIVSSTLPAQERSELARMKLPSSGQPGNGFVEVQLGDERYLVTTFPLSPSTGSPVSLVVLRSLDKATAFLDSLNHLLIGLGAVTLLAGGALGFLIAENFTRPLANLVSAVNALEGGDYQYPLCKSGKDEVGVVTNAFGKMRTTLQNAQKEQKELESRLRQAHKMEAVGRLAGGVAHDFNNLLTIIRGHSDLMAERSNLDEKQRNNVEQIQKAAARAVGMTRQLLAFSRMQVLQPRVVDLNAIITDMSKMLPRLIGEHIEYSFVGDPQLFSVQADPGQIEQVLMNLAVNARDAMPQGGKLTVKTSNAVLDAEAAAKRPAMTAGEYAHISVSDTGCGMDEQTKAHIFEPFFTTKEIGRGTGLGLATVYGIVKQSGGFVWVESSVGVGTTFDIFLPRAKGPVSAVIPDRAQQTTERGSGTILIAEDESGVRDLASQTLRAAGYTVLEAKNGEEALQSAEQYACAIDLLLTDVVMPRVSGVETAEKLRAKRPGLKVLLMSGYSEYSHGKKDSTDLGMPMLQKPFSLEALTARVREVLQEKKGFTEKRNQGREADRQSARLERREKQ
jgi:signal transduction histidine kinase/FixJ family two-component response regulator